MIKNKQDNKLFITKKIVSSFVLWLFSIGLFDLILFLKKDNQALTNIEGLFLFLIVILGVICFLIFILTLEKKFHQKYPRVKANIFASFSFVFFLIFGIGLIIAPFILASKNKPQMVKTTQASKNTLISSGLKLGSTGEEVKVLQAALSTDKSIYPSGIVSGYYGKLTKQAVVNFQEKYNLSTTGEVNQQTADKFNEVYGDKTKEYYLSNISTSVSNSSNKNTKNYIDPDPLINCNIHANCGGGTRLLKKSVCNNSTCCQIGDKWYFYLDKEKCTQDQRNYISTTTRPSATTSTLNSNKVPVFLSYYGYITYCPSQNVDAVKSIDQTMVNKKSEWSKAYQDCVDLEYKTDSCHKSCEEQRGSASWNCIQLYGDNLTGQEYQSCQDKVTNDYLNCATNCPNPYTTCEWVYSEQKMLDSQINDLCK